MTLFDSNHLAHVIAIVLWQMQCAVFCFVLFGIWGQFPSTSPWGLVFGGAIYQRVFLLLLWGANIHVFGRAYTWRGLFWEFYGSPSIKSQICNIVPLCVQSNAIVTGSIYMFLFLQFVTCIGVPMIDYNQPSIKIFKQHDNQF